MCELAHVSETVRRGRTASAAPDSNHDVDKRAASAARRPRFPLQCLSACLRCCWCVWSGGWVRSWRMCCRTGCACAGLHRCLAKDACAAVIIVNRNYMRTFQPACSQPLERKRHRTPMACNPRGRSCQKKGCGACLVCTCRTHAHHTSFFLTDV